MVKDESLSLIQADYQNYEKSISSIKDQYLRYPREISIETAVLCNARCKFCAYKDSPRKGQKLSTELFKKIVKRYYIKEMGLKNALAASI